MTIPFAGWLFYSTLVIGLIANILAFRVMKYPVSATRSATSTRAFAILVFSVGFSLHTLGDYLAVYYGTNIEFVIESASHVVLFAAFLMFLISARKLLETSKEYDFR